MSVPLAVCATPIGNLGDVTLRVLEELAAAETVLCEDTRHTRVLLAIKAMNGTIKWLPLFFIQQIPPEQLIDPEVNLQRPAYHIDHFSGI